MLRREICLLIYPGICGSYEFFRTSLAGSNMSIVSRIAAPVQWFFFFFKFSFAPFSIVQTAHKAWPRKVVEAPSGISIYRRRTSCVLGAPEWMSRFHRSLLHILVVAVLLVVVTVVVVFVALAEKQVLSLRSGLRRVSSAFYLCLSLSLFLSLSLTPCFQLPHASDSAAFISLRLLPVNLLNRACKKVLPRRIPYLLVSSCWRSTRKI